MDWNHEEWAVVLSALDQYESHLRDVVGDVENESKGARLEAAQELTILLGLDTGA